MDDMPEAPRPEGGNAKYAIIGVLLLLGGGAGIFYLTKTPAPAPPPTVAVVHDASVPPLTPTVAPPIELPPEEPDAGPPPEAGAPRIRYVTRYVSECSGTLTDPAGVNRTAQANFGALRACYERELRGNPALRGPLTAELKINTAGHVEGVRVATPMNSNALVNCVKASLQRLSVPPSRGGCAIAQVRYNFSPRE